MTEKVQKPIYPKERDTFLFNQLRKEVHETVRKLEPERKYFIKIKALIFPILYIGCYASALIWGANVNILYACYALLGILLVINFLNLIHEAVHHTLFDSRRLNNWYIHFFDFMGANSYVWKVRHIRLHHNYPNVMGWDSDIDQSDIARIFPHGSFSKMHRYQHLYLPFLYPFYLFNWLLIRDFKDFFNKEKVIWKVTSIPKVEYVKLFIFKGVFLFYTLVLPVLVLGISIATAITAFLIMVFTASIISLLVLLSPHASTESEFPLPDENGIMPTGWLSHQLRCTNDVKEDNWFTRFFMGCFNYHIAHHLFPAVNHVYYPEVTQIIKRFANEHNLPYRQFPLAVSLKKHYQLLKSNAVTENLFEETM